MEKNIFVARERELAQLDAFLKQALDAQGLACFVTGEAGSGKTALVTEFARRAQGQFGDLAVAFGQSDAQTGVGDAHLPFREVLGQLTGDVEAKLAQGAITEENASRLKKLLVLSGQALVEVGPDLIGIFVPGVGLATRVGTFAAEKAGWLDKLEQLVGKSKKSPEGGESGIKQSHIFEQYSKVLIKLSDKHPLLIILDDLQWADTASISLLFHLVRRLEGHRILIVGTYRPEEVAIGRAGERHPLEKVLAEFKRYYGDIRVDLDKADEADRTRFVDAFLDTEPNQLSAGFRQKLFQHTGGHALFTVELLRNMQERGDLVLDDVGQWVETLRLAWESLPERVEGVIEERIGRLGGELREMLTIGSVEGEDFTAEVIARVKTVEAYRLVRSLSGELERRHRLVRERGTRQLDCDGQRLSLYRFQHNLFQKYLYTELGEAERTYLHEVVGNALESLYGDQVDEIVVQLARHFEEAKISEKARTYLELAGRQAADRFANDEAIAYFNRSLDLVPENQPDKAYTLLFAREKIYDLQGERESQVGDLGRLQKLAEVLDSDQKRGEVALRQAAYANATSDYAAAVTAAQEAVRLAQMVQDTRSQAVGYFQLGNAAFSQGDIKTAYCHLEQALTLSRVVGLRQVEANILRTLGVINVGQCDYNGAKTFYEESLLISRADGDRWGEGKTLNNLGVVSYEQGDYTSTREYFEQALSIVRKVGDRRSEGNILGNLGAVSERDGDLHAARNYYEQVRLSSREVGDRRLESIQLGNLGNVSASLGDYTAAKVYLENAMRIAHEIGSKSSANIFLNGLGSTLVKLGDYSAAFEFCEQSLRLARELGNQQNEAIALGILGFIFDCIGNFAGAWEHYEDCLQIARSIGFRIGEGSVLANLGLLLHHLGEDTSAQEHCNKALEIAQELDDASIETFAVTALGHTLVGLSQLTEAVDAYQRALTLRRNLGQSHLAMEPLAGLASICLIQGNPTEAQTMVEEIFGFLESHTLDGTQEPFRIYLTCYQVLIVNKDPRAEELLNTAHRLLQERAAKIVDEGLRHSYLENVTAHREILLAFSKTYC